MRSIKNYRLAAAVAAALTTLCGASIASAQYRIGQDGHANDASPRIGSGGINEGGSPSHQLVTGNQIVTGDVTGGRQFRGGVPYGDPLQFRGVLPGQGLDDFIRDSSGVPQANQPAFGLDTPRAFYGDSRGVAPPVGSVREGFTGSYVGTSITAPDPYSSFMTAPGYQNLRLGNTTIVGSTSNDNIQPSISSLAGSIDGHATNDQQGLSVSPLYGVRPANGTQSADTYYSDRLAALRPGEASQSTFNSVTVEQMRQQLNNPDAPADGSLSNVIDNSANALSKGVKQSTDPNGQLINGQPNNGGRTTSSNPLNATNGPSGTNTGALTNQPLDNRISGQPLNSSTDLSSQLPSASKQSSQYSELNQRLQKFQQTHPLTPAEQLLKLRQQKAQAGKNAAGKAAPAKAGALPGAPGTTRPAANLPGATQPGVPEQPAIPAQPEGKPETTVTSEAAAPGKAEDVAPLKVGSLATGIKAKGLHDLMSGAEDLIHQGKFASAIIKYNEAERVAPNNPLIPLGRAQAELGAGYYGKAESDLRRVFANDPAVLMGQYDLTALLSQQRVDYLNKDLKDLANTEIRSERPWFLLSYIAYNTGDAAAASKYLEEAENRSSTKDPVLQLMRTHWSLPKASTPTTAPTDLNK